MNRYRITLIFDKSVEFFAEIIPLELVALVRILPPQPPCPPEKDIGRTNLRAARLLRFFYVQNLSAEKKISEGVGMDLNYRPPALQAGFAMFFADPAFFSCPDW